MWNHCSLFFVRWVLYNKEELFTTTQLYSSRQSLWLKGDGFRYLLWWLCWTHKIISSVERRLWCEVSLLISRLRIIVCDHMNSNFAFPRTFLLFFWHAWGNTTYLFPPFPSGTITFLILVFWGVKYCMEQVILMPLEWFFLLMHVFGKANLISH